MTALLVYELCVLPVQLPVVLAYRALQKRYCLGRKQVVLAALSELVLANIFKQIFLALLGVVGVLVAHQSLVGNFA